MIELRSKDTGEAHCPYCREDLSELPLHVCESCQVVYHEACAEELATCATLGCEERLSSKPALVPPAAAAATCRGCLRALHGIRQTCPHCDAEYHVTCAYGERDCRRCNGRLFPVRRRSFRAWAFDFFDGLMENVVGLACVLGLAAVVGVLAYFFSNLSPSALDESLPLLLILPPAIMALWLGAAMLVRRVWRDYSREIRGRAPR